MDNTMSMLHRVYFLAVLFSLFEPCQLLGAECGDQKPAVGGVSTPMVFDLTDAERSALEKKAEYDPDAAFRLYEYYGLSHWNYERLLYWAARSMRLNHRIGRYNLASWLSDNVRMPQEQRVSVRTVKGYEEELRASILESPDCEVVFPLLKVESQLSSQENTYE